MYQLPEPAVDDSACFVAVAGAKLPPRRQRLQAILDDVLSAYDGYVQHAPDLGGLAAMPVTHEQKKALIHAYSVPTAPMNELRVELMDSFRAARCALCGLSESAELDHYLPKEQYPEFSIFSKNLVPICAPCNKRKSDKILIDGTPVRRFLHVYFDQVPQRRFLQATLEINGDVFIIKFSSRRPGGVSTNLYRLLQSHIAELGLVVRYQKMALQHMSDARGAYRRLYELDGTGEALSEELGRIANDLAENYGQNYWLSVLNRALAGKQEFWSGGFEALDAGQ